MKPLRLGAVIFFIGLLYCLLLAAGNLFIYQQQKDANYRDFEALQASELNLLEDITQNGLLSQNYAFIEWSFKRWGSEYHKIVSLSLENTHGFALISYQRSVPAKAQTLASQKKITMHDDVYLVKLSTDTIEVERKLEELLLQLFLISTGATILLLVLLWFVFMNYAIKPLTAETRRRKKAEEMLSEIKSET